MSDTPEIPVESLLAECGWRERAPHLWEDWRGQFALVGPVFVHIGRDFHTMTAFWVDDLAAIRERADAAREEREACAKLADEDESTHSTANGLRAAIARQIRARAVPTPSPIGPRAE